MKARMFLCFVAILFTLFILSGPAKSDDDGAKAVFFGKSIEKTDVPRTAGNVITEETVRPSSPQDEQKSSVKPAKQAAISKEQRPSTAKKPVPKTSAVTKRGEAQIKGLATGLSYWIEVIKPNGKVERCTADSRVFKSGERIRFAFRANKEGYIYLIAVAPSGAGKTLFPDARINEGKNIVAQYSDYRIPIGEKSFVLNPPAGEEKVLIFFSESEIHDINNYFDSKRKIEAQDTKKIYALAESRGSKEISFEEDKVGTGCPPVAEGHKEIIFEDDAVASGCRAAYIVDASQNPGSVIFKEIKLRHE